MLVVALYIIAALGQKSKIPDNIGAFLGIVLGLAGKEVVTVASVALSVPMLQAWVPTHAVLSQNPSFPAWSLSAEAFFYAVFPVLVWSTASGAA